jgi:hypothetical protein
MVNTQTDDNGSPLLSNGFLLKVTALIGLFAVLTAGMAILGKYYGDRLALGDHTLSHQQFDITVGQDRLTLPANMIRFENQRQSGTTEILSVYLAWPEMDGYSPATDRRFSDPAGAQDLVFLEFSQSVMSRDMSGRLGPIYSKLFRGEPEPGPSGLVIHRLEPKSGFGNEVILTGMTAKADLYVVRCLLPGDRAKATTADCQRDVHVGRDLTLLYRFSSSLLPQWETLDNRMIFFAQNHLKN